MFFSSLGISAYLSAVQLQRADCIQGRPLTSYHNRLARSSNPSRSFEARAPEQPCRLCGPRRGWVRSLGTGCSTSCIPGIAAVTRRTWTSAIRECAERPRSLRWEALEHGIQPCRTQRGEEVLDVRPWQAVHGLEAECSVFGDTGAVELEEAESVEEFVQV